MGQTRSEKAITEAIKRRLAKAGAFFVKFHGTRWTQAGTPDILVCYRGHFVAIEVKRPGEEATPIQQAVMRQIERSGGIAIVAEHEDEVEPALDAIDVRVDGVIPAGAADHLSV